jgi:DNA-binding transcriptional ArsR family regulator
MELIVAACRLLASRPRLRLLQAVYAHPDATVQTLAQTVGQPVYTTSHHLNLLAGYRFIHTEPSGRHVYCQPMQQALVSNRFLSSLQELLHDVFAHGDLHRTVVQVCDESTPPSWETVFDALVKLFTTYTHLRRLLILREVTNRGDCTADVLRESIGMSEEATQRHVDKLLRRGMLAADAVVPDQWHLAPLSGPVCRRKLWAAVQRELLNG